MKLAGALLLSLFSSLASASIIKTVAGGRKGGGLLQSNASRAEGGCIPPFCPLSNLAGSEGSSGVGEASDFFTKDFEKMDELPNYEQNSKPKQCHPKCRWTCGTSKCNSLCTPRCKAPKCVTACNKINLSGCKRKCSDPQCAVVCPPQCEHGRCPKCKTVCGESKCELSCGRAQCESQCSDPDCVWDCKPNPACAKPTCKMTCDNSVCSFGKDQKLPSTHEVPYMGEEIAWRGLGKIPEEHLKEFAPKMMSAPKPLGGPKMLAGAPGPAPAPSR